MLLEGASSGPQIAVRFSNACCSQASWALRRTWWAQRSSCADMPGELAGRQNQHYRWMGREACQGCRQCIAAGSTTLPSCSDYVTGTEIAVDGGGAALPMLAVLIPEAYKPQAYEGRSDRTSGAACE